MNGTRLAPSAINRYLHENSRRRTVDKEGIEWVGGPVRIPDGAGSAISSKLAPILEHLVDEIHRLALQLLDKENEYRKAQSQYVLENPRTEHYEKAALLVTNEPSKYIYRDSLDNIGGRQRDEKAESSEPSESTDP